MFVFIIPLSTVPSGFESYEWFDGSNSNSVIVTSEGVEIPGTKDVWVTVTNENGCECNRTYDGYFC